MMTKRSFDDRLGHICMIEVVGYFWAIFFIDYLILKKATLVSDEKNCNINFEK